MRTYSREEEKRVNKREEEWEARHGFEYHDLYEFFYGHDHYYDDITMDDVRKGWLLSLLIKLGLRSPKNHIDLLHW